MGHTTEVFDIIGFSCVSNDGNLRVLDAMIEEEDPCEWEAEGEKYRNVYSKLEDLGVGSVMSDRMMGTEPMAIGWWTKYSSVKPTDEDVKKLKDVLEEAGLKPTRLDKDRFLSYG